MLVAGLGNPGPDYVNTRHNAGFMVVDRLAGKLGAVAFEAPGRELVALRAMVDGVGPVVLVKPSTFMNRSGVAVGLMAAFLGLAPESVCVVCDCLDLPLGRIRLRQGGSSGGHRGIASVIRELGTDQFPRLRVGIGRPESGAVIDHVLSDWTAAELPLLDRSIAVAAEAVLAVVRDGVEAAMNRFNGWAAAADNAKQTQGEPTIEDL